MSKYIYVSHIGYEYKYDKECISFFVLDHSRITYLKRVDGIHNVHGTESIDRYRSIENSPMAIK